MDRFVWSPEFSLRTPPLLSISGASEPDQPFKYHSRGLKMMFLDKNIPDIWGKYYDLGFIIVLA